MRFQWTILVAIVAAVSLMPLASATQANLSVSGLAQVARTSDRPITEVESVIESYGSFSLARLSDGSVAAVEGPGYLVQTFPDYGKVALNEVRFDPLSRPAGWTGPGAYIIQTAGPVKPAWHDEIGTRGVILDYVPHFAYLVWLDSDTISSIRSALYIRAVAHHGPEFKLAVHLQPQLGVGAAPRSILVQLYDPAFAVDAAVLAAGVGASFDAKYADETPMLPPYRLLKFDGVRLDDLGPLMQRPDIIFVDGYQEPEMDDEVGTQIQAGNIQSEQPVLGYQAWLTSLGIDGTGVIMGHSDGAVGIGHGDFEGRVKGPNTSTSGDSHGTHTMSTILGAPNGGGKDSNGFLYGQGTAPKAGGYTVSLGASQTKTTEMITNGAIGSSNSWNSGSGGQTYGTGERQQDIWVLDGDPNTAGAQPFAQIFSAGNDGSSGLTKPHGAKNIIAVCATENDRGSNINNKASFSSIGYTADGRVKPELCSPGANVWSASSGTTDQYRSMSGTSMSCPHVAGATALVYQWYNREYGTMPSPAMNKAVLVNGLMDMKGGNSGDIPNINEGWGRVHLITSFSKSTGAKFGHFDGKTLATGAEFTISAKVADTAKPFKVTLAWSDAPAASGANPALVNDLDLTVEGSEGVYAGNDFATSWSKTGGTPSKIDNLENVFVQTPTATYTVKVRGTNVPSGPQAFALVIQNSDAGSPSGSVALSSPTGGEKLRGGDSVNVGWTSTGALAANSVSLSFSKDGGTAWDPPFASNQPLNGSSPWPVPAIDTAAGMIRAEAQLSAGGSVKIESGKFTVDSTTPVATVQALPALTTVAAFDVAFTANDTGTGLAKVEIFFRVGGGQFTSAGTPASSPLKFTATTDGKHEFYASGTDAVGNIEAAPAQPEASTLVDLVPPALVSSSPANSAVNVAPDVPIDLTFSEEMDRATVESGITITPAATKGAYTWDATGVKVSFPLSKLALLTQYDIKVAGKDLAGRDLAATSVKFTTSKIPTIPAKLSGKVTDVFTSDAIAGVKVTATLGTLAWEATTDAAGAYVLDKLPGGTFTLKATMSSYADGSASVTLAEGGSEVKDFVLTPPGMPYSLIRGKVVDEAGEAIEGAEVEIAGVQPVTTGADGTFEFKVSKGTHSVGATKSGMTGDPTDVTVGDWEIKEVTLTMKVKPASSFDLMGMSVAGIPLMWLLILLVAVIAIAAVASRARKRGGKCQWCSTPFSRGATQCPNCGAPVATAPQQSTPAGPPMQDTAPAPPPPPPYQPVSSPPPAGDSSTWQPGPPPD